jgi:hypothetical protein
MAKRFELQVCQIQHGRVAHVNGAWQGKMAIDPDNSEEVLNSCPAEWEYLGLAGMDGWDLVGVVGKGGPSDAVSPP